jgi:hypothetical protein
MKRLTILKGAIAAYLFFSASCTLSPTKTEAASPIITVVSNAKWQMKKAATYVTIGQNSGKVPNRAKVLSEYKKAKTVFIQATKAVEKTGGEKKKQYLKELNSTYKLYMTNRIGPFLNADTLLNATSKAQAALQEAIDVQDLDALQLTYTKFGSLLTKNQLEIYNNVYDAPTRQLFLKEFKSDQAFYNQFANDVVVYQKLVETTQFLELGKLPDASKSLIAIQLLLDKTSKTFKADLTKEYNDLLEVFTEAITPPVPSLDYIEATNGILNLYFDIAVTSLKAEDIKVTMTINGGTQQVVNPLVITLNEDKTIANITVKPVNPTSEDQSVVYLVEYVGELTTSDAFVVNK